VIRSSAGAYDAGVRRDGYEAGRRRPLPVRAVLVALLLVGLLGMHGLGSAAPPQGEEHPRATHATGASTHGSGASMPVDDPQQERACHGSEGGPAHHSAHADDLCAAGGVSGAPELSAPAVSPLSPSGPAPRSHVPARYEPEGGRAPPSLAELQLLRI
jgi:hypothetical protein